MADYPTVIFTGRQVEDREGVVYDAGKKKVFYSKDHNDLIDEIVAIETILGINPQGDWTSVADYLAGIEAWILNYASGAEVNTGTDEDKYLNCKSIADSDYVKEQDVIFGMFKDSRDDNVYKTIKIGTQTWMLDNLRYLPQVDNNAGFAADGVAGNPAYGVYDYDGTDVAAAKLLANYDLYGVLYNWFAVDEVAIAPSGWHIPTDEEFKVLEEYLGMTETEADDTDWRGTNEGTKLKPDGSSGFEGKLAGLRNTDGSFINLSSFAYFWSSSVSGSNAWSRHLRSINTTVRRRASTQTAGCSVRCLKD